MRVDALHRMRHVFGVAVCNVTANLYENRDPHPPPNGDALVYTIVKAAVMMLREDVANGSLIIK